MQILKITPRWAVHTRSRHFGDLPFTPERYWLRRTARRKARANRAGIGNLLFTYEIEDTRTGKREPA